MLECRNCGGALRYDIGSQELVCDHCGSTFSPGEIWKERVASQAAPVEGEDQNFVHPEQGEYEVTVFTCPQCGGEIISYQNEATEFCSYCGASVALEGRMVKEQQPKYIVPFSVTREECIDAYRAHLASLPFVPADLKKEETEQKFCGIYMPFWLYKVQQTGPMTLEGTRRSGDYIEYCRLETDIDTTYERICYDASSAFDDTLAQSVAPFDFYQAKDFNPAYLCGFYADRADVKSNVYTIKALQEAADQTFGTLTGADSAYRDMTISESEKSKIPGKVTNVENALLPVWFMTWRSGDRVSYSIVNGTTRKVTADVPVDRKKYLLVSALAGIALAVLLYFLFPVIIPVQSVRFSFIMAVIGLWLYRSNFHERVKQESHTEDAGFTGATAYYQKKQPFPVKKVLGWTFLIILGVLYLSAKFDTFALIPAILSFFFFHLDTILYLAALALGFWLYISLMSDYEKVNDRKILRDTLPLILGAVLSIAVMLVNPPWDFYYYAVTVIIGACLLNILLGMIGQYNDLATRPLPVFHNRERGDGNA